MFGLTSEAKKLRNQILKANTSFKFLIKKQQVMRYFANNTSHFHSAAACGQSW